MKSHPCAGDGMQRNHQAAISGNLSYIIDIVGRALWPSRDNGVLRHWPKCVAQSRRNIASSNARSGMASFAAPERRAQSVVT